MSDQPLEKQTLERQIPGLVEATSHLTSVAAKAGYRIDKIHFTRDSSSQGVQSTQPKFIFDQEQQSSSQMAAAASQPTTWVQKIPQSPLKFPPNEQVTTTLNVTVKPLAVLPTSPSRVKRSSASAVQGHRDHAPVSKRKRLSDPPIQRDQASTGAFWGTVLQSGTETKDDKHHSITTNVQAQEIHPNPQIEVRKNRASVGGPSGLQINRNVQASIKSDPNIIEADLRRQSTLPAMRLKSPISRRISTTPIPPLSQDPLPGSFMQSRKRLPSPRLRPVDQGGSSSERGFLRRTASHFLDMISPLAGNAPTPVQSSISGQVLPRASELEQIATSGFPSYGIPFQRTTAIPSIAQQVDRQFTRETLPPLRSITQQTISPQYGQQSLSRSASGSGVSYAQSSRINTPPTSTIAEDTRAPKSQGVLRGKRGRKAGPVSDREQFFECEQCNSKFRRKSDKNRHVRVVHEKSRPFVCPMCEKTFGEKSNMLKHRASVHDDVRTFRCPYCDATFSQRGLCDTHVRTVHDKKQAKYFCEHCGLPFSRKGQLNDHYQQAHPEHVALYRGHGAGASSSTAEVRSGLRFPRSPLRGTMVPSGSYIPPQPQVSLPHLVAPTTSYGVRRSQDLGISASTTPWNPYVIPTPTSGPLVQGSARDSEHQEQVPGTHNVPKTS